MNLLKHYRQPKRFAFSIIRRSTAAKSDVVVRVIHVFSWLGGTSWNQRDEICQVLVNADPCDLKAPASARVVLLITLIICDQVCQVLYRCLKLYESFEALQAAQTVCLLYHSSDPPLRNQMWLFG